MSKKQKRRASQTVSQSVQSRASSASTSTSAPMPATAAQIRARSTIFEFKPDYSYIYRDLKRIGILAGSFFVILVVLSFFLR